MYFNSLINSKDWMVSLLIYRNSSGSRIRQRILVESRSEEVDKARYQGRSLLLQQVPKCACLHSSSIQRLKKSETINIKLQVSSPRTLTQLEGNPYYVMKSMFSNLKDEY